MKLVKIFEVSEILSCGDKLLGKYLNNLELKKRGFMSKVFNENLRKFKVFSPNGAEFIDFCKSNFRDIRLGIATNAHLYKGNHYLAYIVFDDNELIFKPKFNNRIETGTIDSSSRFFTNNLLDIINKHPGTLKVPVSSVTYGFRLNNKARKEFFEELKLYIINLKLG